MSVGIRRLRARFVAYSGNTVFMIPRFLTHLLAAIFVTWCACNSPSAQKYSPSEERYVANASSVGFSIEPVLGNGSGERWFATYSSEGKTAKFIIELDSTKQLPDQESRAFDVRTGDGRFVADPGSNANVMLADLKKALEAKVLPTKIQRVTTLAFTFVRFGKNESRSPDGGFFYKPPGNWTPMKMFIGHGDQEGEVFLNINAVLKMGEFSIKDSDYGDIVLSQLARVL
jgi:hypothetical protein